jgi:hypothetical protein
VPPPPPLPENWTCIDEEPVEKGQPPDLIALVMFIVDLGTPLVVPPDFMIRTCSLNDVACDTPIASPTGIGVATEPLPEVLAQIRMGDPSGTLERAARQVLLPASADQFRGYLRISATGYAEVDYVLLDELQLNLEPILMRPNPANPSGPPLRIAPVVVDPIGIPQEGTLEDFYTSVGEMRDDTKATTVARALDCDGRRAANVGLEANIEGLSWAFRNGIPIPGVNSTTDVQGIIGYANLDPVNHTLSALVPNQTRFYREWAIPARPGGIVTVEMRPANARRRQLNLNLLSQQSQQQE